VKALPWCAEGDTRRRRSPGGARIEKGCNSLPRHRTHRGEQGPEAQGGKAGAGNRRLTRSKARGHESAGESRYGSAERDKPLKGKPWTWLRDETSPQGWWRSKPSRACETPRTERDPGVGIPWGVVDAASCCRDEGRGPHGRRSSADRSGRKTFPGMRGRSDVAGLWRRRRARGRMKPGAQALGGRRTERDRRGRPKSRACGGSREPDGPCDPVA